MKLLCQIFNRAERAYLQYMIVEARPDLAGKPFQQQINTYILETIKAHVDAADSELPQLVQRALTYESPQSKGYYAAQFWLYRERYMKLQFEHADEMIKNNELLIENNKTHSLAADAVNMVTKMRDPNNRLN